MKVTPGTSRLEAYTDGIFAIAATLLVLDLSIDGLSHINSSSQLWHALANMSDKFVAFGISFVLLSMLWMIHVRQFRMIAATDTGLLWLNTFRLLFIVLIPFTTSISSEYQDFAAGKVLLPVNFFLAALCGYLTWVWATTDHGHLLDQELQQTTAISGLKYQGLTAVLCGALSVILSPWVGSWAFLAYLGESPVHRLVQWKTKTTTK